jgi:hypothetical protein
MKIIAQIISWICLIVLMVPSVLFLAGKMSSLDQVKLVMFLATILWFIAAPLWMWKASE